MNNFQQARPFASRPVVVPASSTSDIHTFATISDSSGGNPLEEIALWVNNPSAVSQTVTVTVQGQTMTFSVPAQSTIQIFESAVFLSSGGTLSLTNGGQYDVVVWGWFIRT